MSSSANEGRKVNAGKRACRNVFELRWSQVCNPIVSRRDSRKRADPSTGKASSQRLNHVICIVSAARDNGEEKNRSGRGIPERC